MPSAEEVTKVCSSSDVSLIRLLYVGNDGLPRGRVVDSKRVDSALEQGINLSSAMQSFNSLDHIVPGGQFGASGEIRLVPDPDTFQVLPYADRTAVMLCDMYSLDRTLWDADPRSTLTSHLDNMEYETSAAFESEFYLINETEDGDIIPFDTSICFGADGMQSANDIILDMKDSLESQGMELAAYYPEYGPGQQEVVVEHARDIQAADNHVLYKQTVKGVATNNDTRATFAPKPFPDAAGSGCHLHISLWDNDENLFYDPESDGPYGLSTLAQQFIAGVLDHAPALLALTAATIMSYRRLRPQMWASAFVCWGQDNREAICRVPSSQWGDAAATTRFEFKPVDNTANPYLAELGVLAAGMDGVERELEPGEPINQDPAAMSTEERSKRGIERLPETLGDALDEFEDDEVLREAMGETLHSSYLEVKRSQWDEFTGTVSERELEEFARVF